LTNDNEHNKVINFKKSFFGGKGFPEGQQKARLFNMVGQCVTAIKKMKSIYFAVL